MTYSWTCPYCNRIATITDNNVSNDKHEFKNGNREDSELWLETYAVVCPNPDCREYTINASLSKAAYNPGHQRWEREKPALMEWCLRPKSKAKPFPSYIPNPIMEDYQEACVILNDSPKASATLSRRCLQGIIRDFWGISKPRLVEEVNALQGKVDPSTWAAIDAVRSIGNIGAHMEKDINLIIDVDPGEAEMLIQLLETLFKEWYVNRNDRDEQMKQIVAIAQAKAAQKVKPAAAPATKP
jgi:Domain of unknown function (DUF4145)